ncbi:MAG: AAA family ATPase [Pyrinomonadaceae bacterium]|nr:AAA family ATPase [Pyrinomonadaceae bacterium]
MILFINGSFGVGKTTVGRILKKQIKGSVLYNPEWFGSVLMRLPINFRGSGTDDFQDLDLWRKSVVYGIKLFRFFARETVIVPMAFSRKDYFEEILREISQFDNKIRIFCLKAGFEIIVKRLQHRGEKIEESENNWTIRKARICLKAHKNDFFGESIDTTGINAGEVAAEILKRMSKT